MQIATRKRKLVPLVNIEAALAAGHLLDALAVQHPRTWLATSDLAQLTGMNPRDRSLAFTLAVGGWTRARPWSADDRRLSGYVSPAPQLENGTTP